MRVTVGAARPDLATTAQLRARATLTPGIEIGLDEIGSLFNQSVK